MTAYEKLSALCSEIALINSASSLLGWDTGTYMPARGLDYRAKQLAYLSGKAHALATEKKFRGLLEDAEKQKLPRGSKESANVRVIRGDFERAVRIPTKLVEEETALTTHAKATWA